MVAEAGLVLVVVLEFLGHCVNVGYVEVFEKRSEEKIGE